jgi:hypothetical protein
MIATTAFVPVEANRALVAPRPARMDANHGRPAFVFNRFSACRGVAARKAFMDIIQHNVAVGKYLVSPLVKNLDGGRFAASVSIRSGRGSGMHDRVMRFTPDFASHAAALRYAVDQGLGWVRERTTSRAMPAMAALPTGAVPQLAA